ncbi:MAG: hypothetical protein AB7C89_06655 [Intestinibacillus sp.]
MAEFKPMFFRYAHSPAILKALTIEAQNRHLTSPAAMTFWKSPESTRRLTK